MIWAVCSSLVDVVVGVFCCVMYNVRNVSYVI